MSNVYSTIGTGVGVTIGLGLHYVLQQRRNAKLSELILPILKERGPQPLQAIADAIGMGGFFSRGKVVLALGQLTREGKVQTIDAPPGTPQLEKVKLIQYKLAG